MPLSRPPRPTAPWTFPEQGLAVFYGPGNVPKLSHYFLPRLLLQGKRVLFLDGANSANPRLLARLARQPGLSQNEMAAICEVEPITVGRLVDRLEARGLVERRPDPAESPEPSRGTDA